MLFQNLDGSRLLEQEPDYGNRLPPTIGPGRTMNKREHEAAAAAPPSRASASSTQPYKLLPGLTGIEGAATVPPSFPGLSPAVAANVTAAMRGSQQPPFIPPAAATPGGGSTNPNLLALYQSPLWQVAMRQQQIQQLILAQSLSSGNPFLNPLQTNKTLAEAAAASAAPFEPPSTTSSSTTGQNSSTSAISAILAAASSSPPVTTSATAAGLLAAGSAAGADTAAAYRDYFNKFMRAQEERSPPRRPRTESEDAVPLKKRSLSTSDFSTTSQPAQADSTDLRKALQDYPPVIKAEDAKMLLQQQQSLVSQLISDKRRDSGPSSRKLLSPQIPSSTTLPAKGRGRGNRSEGGSQNGREKLFTCKTCNRSFGYKHVLQNHERTHTGEKPFECTVCHKRFTRDHHLKTHMRLHTGEKPYSCTHCDRLFVQVANLRRHLRVHTGEKPYRCELCEARFSDSNQLKAHMLIHKGEKPFTCDKCEGKFRRRHHLAHHACPMRPEGEMMPLPPSSPPLSPGASKRKFMEDIYKRPSLTADPYQMKGIDEEHMFLLKNNPELALPGRGFEIGLQMLRAEAERKAAEQQKAQTSSPSSGSSSGRSRKPRDPKRLRQSPSREDEDDAGEAATSVSDTSGETPRDFSSKAQTEPEDLSKKPDLDQGLRIKSNLELMTETGEEKETVVVGDDDKENSSEAPTTNSTSSAAVSPVTTPATAP